MNEDDVEQQFLEWLHGQGYEIAFGPDITPDPKDPATCKSPARPGPREVILERRLIAALRRLNDHSDSVLEEAARRVMNLDSPSLFERNKLFHKYLLEGVPVQLQRDDGSFKWESVRIVDFDNPAANDWLAVNQFTCIESGHDRRPDVVLFLNGLPVVVIELKNPASRADVKQAWNQIQTYLAQIPSLFSTNGFCVVSDGLDARMGSITGSWDRFKAWRTHDGRTPADKSAVGLEILTQGLLDKGRLLDMLRNFCVFTEDAKVVGYYHQFMAANQAVEAAKRALKPNGDGRGGVIWHTQGSGKSFTMAFFAGKLVQDLAFQNPTIVVLTDRNDLDDQLFGTFNDCKDHLRQEPRQAEDRKHLQELLNRPSGGIVFTTIQKFLPEPGGEYPALTERENVIVIADEAHRSQYGLSARFDAKTGETKYGYAKHMRDALPNATFVGFTGTPVEKADKNTPQVFGEYVDIYDISRSVEDEVTVKIYYEARLAKLKIADPGIKLDEEFEEVTEGEELEGKERLKSKWSRLEAIVAHSDRIQQVAKDIVEHFEKRQETLTGKAMVVCMSRRICMDLYDAIIKLRPDWRSDEDDKGRLKVVMTGNASEGPRVAQHARNKTRRQHLAKRFKDEHDQLQMVIVRDMWLTGFDVPSLHTMYVDKPMDGHNLMQAIARVNRVFKDKPGGLVVDYIGIGYNLKKALQNYSKTDQREVGINQDEAAAVMVEKYEVVQDLFHSFDYSDFLDGSSAEKLRLIPAAMEHVLAQEDGKKRYLRAVQALTKAFSLAAPHEECDGIRDEVAFFQAVRHQLIKATLTESREAVEGQEAAIQQLLSKAISPDGVMDVYKAAGLGKPDISILSEEFLREVQHLEHRNLALEMLEKLIHDEIRVVQKRNLVQARSFQDLLQQALNKYRNRSIEAARVIEELIALARQIQEAGKHGEELGLSEEELAFFDALGQNDSARDVMGDEKLCMLARELVETVRQNTSIDWTLRENARAKLRVAVKRILRKYGYPPDLEKAATETVLEQAALAAEGHVVSA